MLVHAPPRDLPAVRRLVGGLRAPSLGRGAEEMGMTRSPYSGSGSCTPRASCQRIPRGYSPAYPVCTLPSSQSRFSNQEPPVQLGEHCRGKSHARRKSSKIERILDLSANRQTCGSSNYPVRKVHNTRRKGYHDTLTYAVRRHTVMTSRS